MISGIAATAQSAIAQQAETLAQAMPGMKPGTMTAQVCIESCWRSHAMCLETERYCLEKGGVHVMPAHLALLADCAEMCQKTANSLLRRSSQHAVICTTCAQLCDACAEQCEAMKDDERMLLCARTCRECAAHCRDMSKIAI
jgi:hypothetical protein